MLRTLSLSLFCVIALVATSCSGSTADERDSAAPSSSPAESDQASDGSDESNTSDADESNPVCGSLSISEIEAAVGRIVTETVDMGSTDGFGACAWRFEPLTEGPLAGEAPELIVQTFMTTEFYDVAILEFPDQPPIDGIGDAAVSRADGEITFASNGRAGNIGTLLAFDTEQTAASNTAVQELAVLVASRL